MQQVTLYQLDSKGKTRVWSIEAILGLSGLPSSYKTTAGILGGKMVETIIDIHEGKNLGRANATSAYEQACLEAQAKVELKKKDGYVDSLEDLKPFDTLGSGVKAPMLAQKYDPSGKQSSSKTLTKLKLEGKWVGVQRKKDGNRCLIAIDETTITFNSRKGTPLAYDFPRLQRSLRTAYERNKLSGTVVLDGELFSKEVSFNTLNGILKKKALSLEQKHILNQKIRYHLYDVQMDRGYEARAAFLLQFHDAVAGILVEETFYVNATDAVLLDYLKIFLAEGEEGLMIRQLDMPYEHKRTWQLIKYKVDQTEEYQLIGMEEHALGGMVGAFVLKAPAGTVDREGKPITEFKAGTTSLSHEEATQMWQAYLEDLKSIQAGAPHVCEFVNKQATVRFFDLSEYGIPRFPKVIGFRADV